MRELYAAFLAVISKRRSSDTPWRIDEGPTARFAPDYDTLLDLVAIPIAEESGAETGRLAKSIDAWVASELRRAGFEHDEVWPRPNEPRVLPRDLSLYLQRLSRKEREVAKAQILRNKGIAPADARILGRAYVKQVDVLIAQWSRGPELLVSTKSMVSSFRNNLPNRFEESYGDAKNLRGRHPLASMGFLFFLRSTVADDPATLERVVDMLRKLRQEQDVYDATALVLGEWSDPPHFAGVVLRNDLVPEDLRADQFLAILVAKVLERTPIDMHVRVRQLLEHRHIAVEEADEGSEDPAQ